MKWWKRDIFSNVRFTSNASISRNVNNTRCSTTAHL